MRSSSWHVPRAARSNAWSAKQLQARLGEAAHQGIVAEVVPLAAWSEEQLLEAVAAARNRCCWRSMACRIRTTSAPVCAPPMPVECWRVVVPRDRAAPLNATARKVAAGAAESTPVVTVTNLARTLGC